MKRDKIIQTVRLSNPVIDIGNHEAYRPALQVVTQRRSSQVVRQWFAKPSFEGSIPSSASHAFELESL
jgi:hypothetical protein